MRTVAVLLAVFVAGCSDDPPQTVRHTIEFGGGSTVPEKERAPYSVEWPDTAFGGAMKGFAGSRVLGGDNRTLMLMVVLHTPKGKTIRRVAGTLEVKDAGGKTLLSEAVEHNPEVSFQEFAILQVTVPYDDNNATHRSLRFDDGLTPHFKPSRIELADGTVETP